MDTKLILETLLSYYTNARRVGHTDRLVSAAKEVDKPTLVLAGTANDATYLKDLGVDAFAAMDERLYLHLIGTNKPLLVDNSAMVALLSASLDEINKLERKIERLKKQLCLLDAQYGLVQSATGMVPPPAAIVSPIEQEVMSQ